MTSTYPRIHHCPTRPQRRYPCTRHGHTPAAGSCPVSQADARCRDVFVALADTLEAMGLAPLLEVLENGQVSYQIDRSHRRQRCTSWGDLVTVLESPNPVVFDGHTLGVRFDTGTRGPSGDPWVLGALLVSSPGGEPLQPALVGAVRGHLGQARAAALQLRPQPSYTAAIVD